MHTDFSRENAYTPNNDGKSIPKGIQETYMQFGISFLPDADPSTKSARAYFSDALALSAMADEA
jgi:hypothetical protein